MSISMTYGDYSFIPVPMINLSRTWRNITADGLSGNFHHNLTLEGTLTPLPSGHGSIANIDALQDSLMSALEGCGPLVISGCDTELLNVYPKVESVVFPPTSNNWVNTSTYTIEMNFEELSPVDSGRSQYVDSFSETWDFSIQESPNPYVLTYDGVTDQVAGYDYSVDSGVNWYGITHTMAVQCSAACRNDGSKQAGYIDGYTVIAQNWGEDSSLWDMSHLNAPLSTMNKYNHMRSTQIDQAAGVFNMTENWIVSAEPSGAIEDFNITIQATVDNPITRVNIDGRVQGLELRDWGTTGVLDQHITAHKYNDALDYWNGITSKRIYPRCQLAALGAASRSLHPTALDHSVGHQITDGSITYNYSFDDRPLECVSNALYESIVITDTSPNDVFAQIVVPGRAAGPVLQDIGTVTASTRNVSIDVVVPIGTGCTASILVGNAPSTEVTALLTDFYTELTNNYGQVFKHQDTENWSPKIGRYTREIGWTFQDC